MSATERMIMEPSFVGGKIRGIPVEQTKMDPRRDYPKFTDAALDFFIRRFPSHPDHAVAVAEVERRRKNRPQWVAPASGQTARLDKGLLVWAVVGLVILGLALLFLLLPIAMARTNRKPRPTPLSRVSVPIHKLSISTSSLTESSPPPQTSRQAHRGEY